jgi:glycerol uptake facilitator protein
MEPLVAEFIGTMILIILGDGGVANVILSKTKGNGGGWIVITAGWGFAVFVAVFMVGQYSGAHINPAVTLGLALTESWGTDFFTGWGDVPTYILAQTAGAFVGGIIVWLTYYQHYDQEEDAGTILGTFSTGSEIRNPLWNTLTEAIGTFVLVFGVFLIASASLDLAGLQEGAIEGAVYNIDLGAVGAIPVALLVFGIGLSLGGPTGYAINPARDLGPRIAHQLLPIKNKGDSDWGYAWIPIVGPFIGAALAAVLFLAIV